MRIELHQLRSFLAVAEELHFRRAAQQLHLAQPALSQQIQRLEERLGVDLFVRNNRRVELTSAGRALREQARRTLGQAEHAIEVARAAGRGELGVLRLGFVGSVSYQLLPMLARRIRDQAPRIELKFVQLTTDAQIAALLRGDIDVGIARDDGADLTQSVQVQPILRERLAAVVPVDHRFAGRQRIYLKELHGEDFIFPPREEAQRFHDWLLQCCRGAGFSPNITQRILQFPALMGLVAAGLGVGLVPAMVRVFNRPDIRFIDIGDKSAHSTVTALTWRGTNDPVVTRFLEQARIDPDGNPVDTRLGTR